MIITGEIETWKTKKHAYGDTTYELLVITSLGKKESYQTFEKHLKHFSVGEKYQFHVSRRAKVLVNIARIRNSSGASVQ